MEGAQAAAGEGGGGNWRGKGFIGEQPFACSAAVEAARCRGRGDVGGGREQGVLLEVWAAWRQREMRVRPEAEVARSPTMCDVRRAADSPTVVRLRYPTLRKHKQNKTILKIFYVKRYKRRHRSGGSALGVDASSRSRDGNSKECIFPQSARWRVAEDGVCVG